MCVYKLHKKCRLCESTNFKLILDLGKQPPSNALLSKKSLNLKEKKFPLRLFLCKTCFHLQLLDVVDKKHLFSNYLYITGANKTMVNHFHDYADYLHQKFLRNRKNSLVIELGSNDGTLLKNFSKYDVKVLGIEPAKNLAKFSKKLNINTMTNFFNLSLAQKLAKKQKADIIIANNVLGHVDNLRNFINGISTLLKDDGVFVFEVPHSYQLLKNLEFDTIYHEHISYFSVTSLQKWLQKNNFVIFNIQKQKVHGGTIRVFVSKPNEYKINSSVKKILELETKFGVKKINTYMEFSNKTRLLKKSLIKTIRELKNKNYKIFGYGSPAKGNVLLNYCNLDNSVIDFLIDVTPLKQNKYSPGMHIVIKSASLVKNLTNEYVGLMLAWNYKNIILEKEKKFRRNGGKFLIPIPKPTIV